MTTSTTPSRTYYDDRNLATPDGELRPESIDELCEAIDEFEGRQKPWQILGDGQHTRRDPAESVVLRTDGVDALLDLDAESGLVRVEAGMNWKTLGRHLEEEGFSLQRYGLHPATATVGGMLARRQSTPPLLRGGSILDGCVALSAHDAEFGDYRYLVAPRKASGPDLRYEFIGAEGRQGAILDATLVVWRPVAQKLLRYDDCSPTLAQRIVEALHQADSAPSWIHYSARRRTLQFALTAPGQLLRSRVQWLAKQIRPADDVDDTEAAEKRRQWLEARHPDRRSHPAAQRTFVFQITPSALTQKPEDLFGDDIEEVEFTDWTPRRATAFVQYNEVTATPPPLPDGSCWGQWRLVREEVQ